MAGEDILRKIKVTEKIAQPVTTYIKHADTVDFNLLFWGAGTFYIQALVAIIFGQMGLNLRKLQHLAGQSLSNAIRLHFDSILLYKHKSFPSAFFISVIAMEELGKAYWADHFVFYSKDVRKDKEFETLFINTIHSDHRAKQLWFLRQMAKVDDRFYHFVESRQLDILKQNSIYVGLQKVVQGQPRTKGKLNNPKKFKAEKSKRQIKMLHDFLVDETLGVKEGRIDFGFGQFNEILDGRLLRKLKSTGIK